MDAEPPYRIIDRRRTDGRRLYDSAAPSHSRPFLNGANRDTRSIVPARDRQTLMSIGRTLYANVDAVRAAVNDMATIAAGQLSVQFDGEDTKWGQQAEEWLYNHDRIADVRGYPYDMQSIGRLLISHTILDGDVATLLTGTESDYPAIQVIPSHRIRGDLSEAPAGMFTGRPVYDGVVVNDYGRHVGYRLLPDDASNYGQATEISATDMILSYLPTSADQIRGISWLGSSAVSWQDFGDSRKYELIAQKIGASVALIESNETGTADRASTLFTGSLNADGTSNTPTHAETFNGGETRYFRAGAGSLEALRMDRPTANQQAFAHDIARHCIAALGWSIDFSIDPTKIGGVNARGAYDRLNRTLRIIREQLLFPFRRRIDQWRIAKAIKLGLLPPSDEWMKWRYKGAADVTADALNAFRVAEGRISKGLSSEQDECASIGMDWEAVMDNRIAYAVRLKERCAAAGVDPSEVRQIATSSFQAFADPQAADNAIKVAEATADLTSE